MRSVSGCPLATHKTSFSIGVWGIIGFSGDDQRHQRSFRDMDIPRETEGLASANTSRFSHKGERMRMIHPRRRLSFAEKGVYR